MRMCITVRVCIQQPSGETTGAISPPSTRPVPAGARPLGGTDTEHQEHRLERPLHLALPHTRTHLQIYHQPREQSLKGSVIQEAELDRDDEKNETDSHDSPKTDSVHLRWFVRTQRTFVRFSKTITGNSGISYHNDNRILRQKEEC